MIRATLIDQEDPSKRTILLGLTAGNIDRLVKGEPIHCTGESVNIPGTDVLIMYGDTPAEVVAELKKHFELPPADKIHIE
jgi:hypothetical protein